MASSDDFKLERLKHILKQQDFLNEYSHKYLTFFQTISTAIITAIFAVFAGWQKLSITADMAIVTIRALELLLSFISIFVAVVIATNIFSWWDYRKDEANIFNEIVSQDFRKQPSLKGIWRWFEFWFLVVVVCLSFGIIIFVEYFAIPLIK
ncbi:hypothetical protein [Thiothrix unzii]|jgi:hypothetical protein|uniref:hypothetical protein n=1 Tax=Thiothrix unzii TaxID=111769 RepID=UPI002A36EC0B|nr:hypothetical protein [Thiothrix unzii]MDX9988981.1 hypothetical protein [Thiothrix unzii]